MLMLYFFIIFIIFFVIAIIIIIIIQPTHASINSWREGSVGTASFKIDLIRNLT